jgi:hypothetical protein
MSEHLAKEADRLSADPVFAKALADIRADSLNELALADADNTIRILRLQQRVAVIDEIRTVLARYIAGAPAEQEDAGSFA